MATNHFESRETNVFSEALVSGLLGGILAGALMLALLAGLAALRGEMPLALLARFSAPGQTATALGGALLHLGVSAVYGALFGGLLKFLPQGWLAGWRRWAAGLFYGLALFALAHFLLLPASASALAQIPAWEFALAHALYGVVLGRASGF